MRSINLYLMSAERRIEAAVPELYRMKIGIKHRQQSDSGMRMISEKRSELALEQALMPKKSQKSKCTEKLALLPNVGSAEIRKIEF